MFFCNKVLKNRLNIVRRFMLYKIPYKITFPDSKCRFY